MFKSYKIPKYTIHYMNVYNGQYRGILFTELCSKCGYRMGIHNDYTCPNGKESFIDHGPEFYLDELNKNIKVL